MATQCLGTNKDSKPCSAAVWKDHLCRWHHPELEAQRQAERVAGGKARSNRSRAKRQLADQVMTISDLDGLLCVALKQVASGRMEPGVGSSMATIAKTIIAVRAAGDLEQRLQALEAANGEGRTA